MITPEIRTCMAEDMRTLHPQLTTRKDILDRLTIHPRGDSWPLHMANDLSGGEIPTSINRIAHRMKQWTLTTNRQSIPVQRNHYREGGALLVQTHDEIARPPPFSAEIYHLDRETYLKNTPYLQPLPKVGVVLPPEERLRPRRKTSTIRRSGSDRISSLNSSTG